MFVLCSWHAGPGVAWNSFLHYARDANTFLWEFSWRSKSFSLLTILACTALTRLCDLCKSTTDSGTLTQTSVFNAHVRAVSHNAPANHSPPPASVRTHVHLPPADRHLTSGSIYKISFTKYRTITLRLIYKTSYKEWKAFHRYNSQEFACKIVISSEIVFVNWLAIFLREILARCKSPS